VRNIYTIIDTVLEVLIIAPLVIILNVLTVAISFNNRRQMPNRDRETFQARKKIEMRLAVVNIIISVSYVSSVIFSTLWGATNAFPNAPINGDVMSYWYYISFHTFTMCNPYILLILSTATRNEFLRFITCKYGVNVSINPTNLSVRAITVR
jgi:hypothetical protein